MCWCESESKSESETWGLYTVLKNVVFLVFFFFFLNCYINLVLRSINRLCGPVKNYYEARVVTCFFSLFLFLS